MTGSIPPADLCARCGAPFNSPWRLTTTFRRADTDRPLAQHVFCRWTCLIEWAESRRALEH